MVPGAASVVGAPTSLSRGPGSQTYDVELFPVPLFWLTHGNETPMHLWVLVGMGDNTG